MKHRNRAGLGGFGLICVMFAALAAEPPPALEVSSPEALSLLKEGNQRFVASDAGAKERPPLVTGQHPYAIVLTCADSRVSPEILFDESLGKLFVIRVAGNVVDQIVLGSIEYAVEHLHSHLLVVLGHDGCGAVGAALEGGDIPPDIAAIVKCIAPAIERTRGQGLDAAVRENARLQSTQAISQSSLVADLVKKKELVIVAGVYHLSSGKVEWLEPVPGK